MGDAYPELTRERERVTQVLAAEHERFGEPLEKGCASWSRRSRVSG